MLGKIELNRADNYQVKRINTSKTKQQTGTNHLMFQRSLIFLFALSFFLIKGFIACHVGCSRNQNETYFAASDTVSPEMMKADFAYVVEKLRDVHPITVNGFTEIQKKIISNIQEEIKQPQTKEKFFFLVNELFHSFHDAHTTQWLVFSQGIDLPLIWLKDGLYVKKDTELLKQGDLILRIGGKEITQLATALNQILWTENQHLLRLEGPWMLLARPYLQHLNLIRHDSVEVICKRAGRELTFQLPVIKLNRYEKEQLPFFAYEIKKEDDLAVLTLNSCQYNAEYHKELLIFFKEVATQNIKNIALDLRRNGGGDSRVIDEFLHYINVHRIKGYGSFVRYSHDARIKTKVLKFGSETFPRSAKNNEKIDQQELLFSGRLFVLTSPNTFSSANMFAAVLQDNGIAMIVGEPTGNKPSCYGHPLSFQMPRTGIYFKISHKQFFRPDSSFDQIDAVYPDVEVYRQIDDVLYDKDSQIDKLTTLIKMKEYE